MSDSNMMARSVSVQSEADSVTSFLSDDIEDVEEEPKEYIEAPYDIMYDYEGKEVRVLKEGERVPCETTYKKVNSTTAIKFGVSEFLQVLILKKIDCSNKIIKIPNSNNKAESSSSKLTAITGENGSVDEFSTPTGRGGLDIRKRRIESEEDDVGGAKIVKETIGSPAGKPFRCRSQADWLNYLDKNFEEVICGGLNVEFREKTKVNIRKKVKLTPRQNSGVINSLNFAVKEQFGLQRPNPNLCRRLVQLLRSKIPDTYGVVESVRSEYGDMPVHKEKGEGGTSNLEKRIAVNFYNKFLRDDVTKPMIKAQSGQLDFSSSKKSKKLYALVPEKWHLASKILPEHYKKSEEAYWKFDLEVDCEKKKEMFEDCREFLQVQFRTMDPGTHIQSLRSFWELPHGPELLSAWFEWVTSGSRDGCLRDTITKNYENVFNMVHAVLSEMKGEAWDKKFEEEDNNSKAKFGNETMTKIFLLRELAKTWKNHAEKIIFIEGEDDIAKISKQPFLHVMKVAQTGEEDYDERIRISLRVGNTIVFDDVTFVGALASLIEVIFVFNLMYPAVADDIFQFVQRILANFGPADGARNEQGKIKKTFIEFQCAIGRIMMDNKTAKHVKMSSRNLGKPKPGQASIFDIEILSEKNKFDPIEITVIKDRNLFKIPAKKKIVINPELSPIEKIREINIAERLALFKKLGFCNEKKVVKAVKSRPKLCSRPAVIRKSERIKNAK